MKEIWYDKSAASWLEALPLGNGRLGAMVYGQPFAGKIQLNEESVVYGGPIERENPDALEYLPEIRKLVKEEKIKAAEDLEISALSGMPQSERPYQTLGMFQYNLNDAKGCVVNYRRSLDMETGIVTVKFYKNGVGYRMESYISREEDMLIVSFEANQPGMLSIKGLLTRGKYYNRSGKASRDTIFIEGDLGAEGSRFRVAAKALASRGTVKVIGEHLIVNDADKVVFLINGVTTFPHRRNKVTNFERSLKQQFDRVGIGDYQRIKGNHIAQHKKIFNRSVLILNDASPLAAIPVDQRLERLAKGEEDQGLINAYYSFGRYLLMSSSQPGGLPANLQGIWCEQFEPPWDAKYTININLEMNYWPAEICNLSECHEPFFDLLQRMKKRGEITAKKMYGCQGFVAHHNTDIWADTAPQDMAPTATYWVLGGAWMATHIWMRYRYTMDLQFLAEMYPIMEANVKFILDFIIEDEGEMVISPTISPENSYFTKEGEKGSVCSGCTMDTALIYDTFTQYLKAADILEDKNAMRKQVEKVLECLPPYQIGTKGQLLEWRKEYEEWEPGHRHFSHLYPLFPGTQINEYDTPELVSGCEKTLEQRLGNGGGYTGWSAAWLINLYARIGNGNRGEEYLKYLLAVHTSPNMMDMHPPLDSRPHEGNVFQIDGNFGGICGIAQLLMQSHLNEIHLLPALPSAWKTGKITGLCAEQGFEVDIEWENNRLKMAMLISKCGEHAIIRCRDKVKILCEGKEVRHSLDNYGRYVFSTQKGQRYLIKCM